MADFKVTRMNGFTVFELPERTPEDRKAFWTEERLKSAKPMPYPVTKFSASNESLKSKNDVDPPIQPDVTAEPYRAGGKLYSDYASIGTTCGSGTVCGNTSIILTAAHMVYIRKSSELTRDVCLLRGASPYSFASFTFETGIETMWVKQIIIPNGWYDYKDIPDSECIPWDYAFLVIGPLNIIPGFIIPTPPSDYMIPLAETTLGQTLNVSSFGYPLNYGGGNIMQAINCTQSANPNNGVLTFDGDPMRNGASGACYIQQEGDNKGSIISVHASGSDSTSYGPVFDSTTKDMFNHAVWQINAWK